MNAADWLAQLCERPNVVPWTIVPIEPGSNTFEIRPEETS